MARRPTSRKTLPQRRRVAAQPDDAINPWPALQALIDAYGVIEIGYLQPVLCGAVANDDDTTYAMLRRREGETLMDLLNRLERAVEMAQDDQTMIDEINRP